MLIGGMMSSEDSASTLVSTGSTTGLQGLRYSWSPQLEISTVYGPQKLFFGDQFNRRDRDTPTIGMKSYPIALKLPLTFFKDCALCFFCIREVPV